MSETPFSITILDSVGNRLGAGPLLVATNLNDQQPLDRLPVLNFGVPALDERSLLIGPGVQFDVYDAQDGYLGRFLFRTDDLKGGDSSGLELRVTADSVLKELQFYHTGFFRNYTVEAVEDVIADLLNIVPGWGLEIDSGIGFTTITCQGNGVWAAIDELRDVFGLHFRMGVNAPRVLQFGAFGLDSGYVFRTISEPIQDALLQGDIIPCRIVDRNRDTSGIINRVVPLGAGEGRAELTIEGSTVGLYTTKTGVNADGSLYYYIEDEESIALYGVRERVAKFTQIRVLTNNDTAYALARDTLKLVAQAYLQRSINPRIEYRLESFTIPPEIRPGDLVRLDVRVGDEAREAPLNVNELFWVMDLNRSRSVGDSGVTRRTGVTISSVDTRRTSDEDVVIDIIEDIRALKINIQPFIYWSENTLYDWVQGANVNQEQPGTVTGSKFAHFPLRFDDKVLDLFSVTVRIISLPLTSWTVVQYDSVGDIIYNWYNAVIDDQYPSDLRFYLNGVNRSSELGGPWAAGGANVQVDFEVDITQMLLDEPGGFRQDHEIVIQARNDRTGDTAVPGFPPLSINRQNHGVIQCNIRITASAQPI